MGPRSVARRQEVVGSDLDLLVRLDPERSLLDLCALGDDLADAIGRRVDVLTDAAVSPYLRAQVASEAVAL